MRKRSATLFARYRSAEDPTRFDRVAIRFTDKARVIKPKVEPVYFQVMWRTADGQRKAIKVGTDLTTAVNRFIQYRDQVEAGREPKPITSTSLPSAGAPIFVTDDSVSDLLDAWIRQTTEAVEQNRMSDKTLLAYRLAANYFKAFCAAHGIVSLDEIRNAPANDLKQPHPIMLFERWLCGPKGISFHEPNKNVVSVANTFRNLNVFFQMQGIKLFKGKKNSPNDPGLLPWSQRPAQPDYENSEEYEVKFFSTEDLAAFRKYSKPRKDEDWIEFADGTAADLVEFLLHTGFRKKEVSNVEFSDVDWTGKELQRKPSDPKRPSIKIGVKAPSNNIPKGFRTKNGKTRRIPIVNLAPTLQARFERMQKAGVTSTLIFPNQSGTPNTHLDEIINEIAARAMKAKFRFSEGGLGLHRFRKTYATTLLDAGVNPRTIQLRLGHSKFETTERYLGKNTVTQAEDAAFD